MVRALLRQEAWWETWSWLQREERKQIRRGGEGRTGADEEKRPKEEKKKKKNRVCVKSEGTTH